MVTSVESKFVLIFILCKVLLTSEIKNTMITRAYGLRCLISETMPFDVINNSSVSLPRFRVGLTTSCISKLSLNELTKAISLSSNSEHLALASEPRSGYHWILLKLKSSTMSLEISNLSAT